MDKFVTIWFTVLFTLCIAAGVRLTEAWTAYIVVGMMFAIFPMVHAHDWAERKIEQFRASCQTRQRVGIYPHDDWK